MFEFFTKQPLWAKAAMLGGGATAGYYGYKYFSGKSGGGVPRGGLGPIEAAASLLPLAAQPQVAQAAQAAQAAQPTDIVDIETVELVGPFTWWDEVSSTWVELNEFEWRRRYGDFVRRYGYPPPHMAHGGVRPGAPIPARPAPPAAHPAPPIAHPAAPFSPAMARTAAPVARSAPPAARPATPAPSAHHQIKP
jgi:hypothetical protein